MEKFDFSGTILKKYDINFKKSWLQLSNSKILGVPGFFDGVESVSTIKIAIKTQLNSDFAK